MQALLGLRVLSLEAVEFGPQMLSDLRLGEEVLGEVLGEGETAGREVELDGDLGVHAAEQILGDGPTFGFVGVEECLTRVTADDRPQLPTRD